MRRIILKPLLSANRGFEVPLHARSLFFNVSYYCMQYLFICAATHIVEKRGVWQREPGADQTEESPDAADSYPSDRGDRCRGS
jgi:hypothetical protein